MSSEEITASSRAEWRHWLANNGKLAKRIFLIYYKKDSGIPSIRYREAVEEALCFGWIDSTVKKIDEKSYKQLFTPRKSTSTWSKINKELVSMLEEQGLMTDSGRFCIEIAKKNGSWDILNDCDNLIIPSDLQAHLTPDLEKIFQNLSPSKKRQYLWEIKQKKRTESRQKAIQKVCNSLRLKEKNVDKI
ncbi:MAG: YdeI/OmpD-associated family protein [Brevinema sp.]